MEPPAILGGEEHHVELLSLSHKTAEALERQDKAVYVVRGLLEAMLRMHVEVCTGKGCGASIRVHSWSRSVVSLID